MLADYKFILVLCLFSFETILRISKVWIPEPTSVNNPAELHDIKIRVYFVSFWTIETV